MFGLSLGFKKSKSSSTGTIDKTETGSQTGSELTSGSKTTTGTSTGSTTSAGTGTSQTAGTQTSTSGTTGAQTQSGTTRSLGADVLLGLRGGVTALLSSILDPNTGDRAMLTRGMDAMGNFDVDAFVNGSLQAAKAQQGTHMDELLGSIFSRVGGNEGNNSASTLLAERAKNDSAATLAGVRQSAEATARQIQQGNLTAQANATAATGGSTLLPALASILKGGEVSTDTSTLSNEVNQALQQSAGSTATSESSQQATNTATSSTEDLVQAVLNALNQTTHTVGTETTKSKGSELGGGASFSY